MPVGILADGDGLNRASGAGHERHEAGAFQLGPKLDTRQIAEGRVDVHKFGGRGGLVAVGHKLLREGHYVRDAAAHGCSQIPDLGCIGPQAGHQARTRGAANGLLTVVVFKDHAARG